MKEKQVPVVVYAVSVIDEQTEQCSEELLVLEKATLRAAGQVGMSDRELISRKMTRKGYRVLRYRVVDKATLHIDLAAAYAAYAAAQHGAGAAEGEVM